MKILIVEDEKGIADFLKQGLEEENFIVDIAEDGIKGLKLSLSGIYDLLILDWMLPGLSGLELCIEYRKKYTFTPVLFLTAKDTVQETIIVLQNGGNDYIKKPFHFEELLARIHVQFRLKNKSNKNLVLGPIVMDEAAYRVFKNEKEIALTQKEFALLSMLIRNKNKVCTRLNIIETVWDIHFDYNTSVIDVFVNALRKKLELNENENYIQTVRGVGYMAIEL